MTVIAHGLVPGSQREAAALVTAEYQEVFRESPQDALRERWLIVGAVRWSPGESHERVVEDAARLADETGGLLVYDRTGPGEVYADLFALAYREERMRTRAAGRILTAGQMPSDVGLPREIVVRRFEAKLASGRVAVAADCPLRDELREQLTRFAGGFRRRGVEAAEEEPNTLLLAAMLATFHKRFRPGSPRYLARDGQTYESSAVSRDPY